MPEPDRTAARVRDALGAEWHSSYTSDGLSVCVKFGCVGEHEDGCPFAALDALVAERDRLQEALPEVIALVDELLRSEPRRHTAGKGVWTFDEQYLASLRLRLAAVAPPPPPPQPELIDGTPVDEVTMAAARAYFKFASEGDATASEVEEVRDV